MIKLCIGIVIGTMLGWIMCAVFSQYD